MQVTIPDFCLVAFLTEPATADAFLNANFTAGEIVAPGDASAVAGARLAGRQLAVVPVERHSSGTRLALVQLAKRHHARTYLIAPGEVEVETAVAEALRKEGFHAVLTLPRPLTPEGQPAVRREPLAMDRRSEKGPFDIIGDVHGCAEELIALLGRLGYRLTLHGEGATRRVDIASVPPGRRVAFVGDLVDRGPASPDVVRIVMTLVRSGLAIAVPGNHDVKLLRWLDGRNVKANHGLDRTIAQLATEPDAFKAEVHAFLDGLVSHAWLDGGELVVAHAGIKEEMIGRAAGAVREFCLYGERSGEVDHLGLSVRYHWAAEYEGQPAIVYGHTPVPEPEWVNNTLCIDTGCCFGGKLTALRWPERETVSVDARATYFPSLRPFGHPPVRPGAKIRA